MSRLTCVLCSLFFLMMRRPPGSTLDRSSAASDVYKRQELVFATNVTQWMDAEAENESRLNKALHYAAWALRTPAGQQHTQQGILFKSPAKLDFQHLLSLDTDESAGYLVHRLGHLRERNGLSLIHISEPTRPY